MDTLGDRDPAEQRQQDDHRRHQLQAQPEAEQHHSLGPRRCHLGGAGLAGLKGADSRTVRLQADWQPQTRIMLNTVS